MDGVTVVSFSSGRLFHTVWIIGLASPRSSGTASTAILLS
jgi:hypothetical protein